MTGKTVVVKATPKKKAIKATVPKEAVFTTTSAKKVMEKVALAKLGKGESVNLNHFSHALWPAMDAPPDANERIHKILVGSTGLTSRIRNDHLISCVPVTYSWIQDGATLDDVAENPTLCKKYVAGPGRGRKTFGYVPLTNGHPGSRFMIEAFEPLNIKSAVAKVLKFRHRIVPMVQRGDYSIEGGLTLLQLAAGMPEVDAAITELKQLQAIETYKSSVQAIEAAPAQVHVGSPS